MNNYFDNNGRYNTNNNRPLIPRQQNYFLERKLLSIHSEDRDINKWPNSNNFAVNLPETIKNIDSMRLVECHLPINYYTFSNYNQNTKLSFTIEPKDPSDNYYTILNDNSMNDYTITIEDGCLQGRFGSSILEFISDNEYKNNVHRLGIPDEFIHHGTQNELWNDCNINTNAIIKKVEVLMKKYQISQAG